MSGAGGTSGVLTPDGPGLPPGSARGAWSGFYPGEVVSAADPIQGGRLQIRVPHAYGGAEEAEKVEDGELPWAWPMFPVTGRTSGLAWVPPVGATVWVTFLGGDAESPIWVGGWFVEADRPSEFASSYEGGQPKTRIVKTDNGHLIEMRWKTGESEIRLETESGNKIRLVDDPALQGTKIEIETVAGQHVYIDDPLKKIEAQTVAGRKLLLDDTVQACSVQSPTGREMVINDAGQEVHLITPTQRLDINDATNTVSILTPGAAAITAGGAASVTAGGLATVVGNGVTVQSTGSAPSVQTGGGTYTTNFVGAALLQYAGALSTLVAGIMALTVAGFLTITGAGIAIVTTLTAVKIGSLLGPHRKLIDARFIAAYNAHTHPTAATGPASPPTQQIVPGPQLPPLIQQELVQTTNLEAD